MFVCLSIYSSACLSARLSDMFVCLSAPANIMMFEFDFALWFSEVFPACFISAYPSVVRSFYDDLCIRESQWCIVFDFVVHRACSMRSTDFAIYNLK